MKFRLGRGVSQKKEDFRPRSDEEEIIAPFLADRGISFMDAKNQILANEAVDEARRGPLASYLREQRSKNPQSAEGIFSRPNLGERN